MPPRRCKQAGEAFAHRRTLVCRSRRRRRSALETRDASRSTARIGWRQPRSVAFLFPGQGAQQVEHGPRAVLRPSRSSERSVDECCRAARRCLGWTCAKRCIRSGRGRCSAGTAEPDGAGAARAVCLRLRAGPALDQLGRHAVRRCSATASANMSPPALPGVFTLPDALTVLAGRARLMQTLPSRRDAGGSAARRRSPAAAWRNRFRWRRITARRCRSCPARPTR